HGPHGERETADQGGHHQRPGVPYPKHGEVAAHRRDATWPGWPVCVGDGCCERIARAECACVASPPGFLAGTIAVPPTGGGDLPCRVARSGARPHESSPPSRAPGPLGPGWPVTH